MDYISVDFSLQPVEPFRDILLGELSLYDFESFEETDGGLRAFIPQKNFSENILTELEILENSEVEVKYTVQEIPAQNWNATWEADFEPIEVNETCRVRAPFHASTHVPFEVVIQPQMSFGTGHHETTWGVMRQMLTLDFKSKDVLDMGSGTGVLAILAEKKGAQSVLAIDVDDWAYQNALENVKLNHSVHIDVEKGDVTHIGRRRFHVILANINKNVLLQDIPVYARCLHGGGILLLSGFFESDVPDLVKKAELNGLSLEATTSKNNWAVMKLKKNL